MGKKLVIFDPTSEKTLEIEEKDLLGILVRSYARMEDYSVQGARVAHLMGEIDRITDFLGKFRL